MILKQPQILLDEQADWRREVAGESRERRSSGFVRIERPWKQYSGKITMSVAG